MEILIILLSALAKILIGAAAGYGLSSFARKHIEDKFYRVTFIAASAGLLIYYSLAT